MHELFGGHVEQFFVRMLDLRFPSDALHQVGFTNPDIAIEEQRIIGGTGPVGLRDAARCCVRKLI